MLIAGSESCARYFASQGADRRKIVIVPTFSQFEEVSSIASSPDTDVQSLRADLGLQNKFIVMFVGRLVAYKGIRELLDAMGRIWGERDDVVLIIVGTGPLARLVSDCKKTLPDNILHFDSLEYSHLVRLYAMSDVHILPSWHEAYGLVCGEALSSGTPSIVTRQSGCSDLIEDGINGYLIESGNPDSIYDALVRFVENPSLAMRMKSNARTSVEGFTVENAVTILKKAFRSATEDGIVKDQ